MSSKIFIPKTCRVGFQERNGTFTNKLAYVIYYGPRGELRKETSWKGWCTLPEKHHGKKEYNEDLTPFDFPNEPTSGFVLNKGIKRYAWSSFGSTRSMIRIYDPRGIEFEIEPENLVGLLMHTDCSKREIQGDLVYAWVGGNLMLIPCASQEYKEAMEFTSLQSQKVSARALKEGATYITKREELVYYIGRHMHYEYKDIDSRGYYSCNKKRVGKKQHMFAKVDNDGKTKFIPIKSVTQTLAKCVNEYCDDRYADWVDEYTASHEYGEIVSMKRIPIDKQKWTFKQHSWRNSFHAYMELGDKILKIELTTPSYWREEDQKYWNYRPSGVLEEDGSITPIPDNYNDLNPRPLDYRRRNHGFSHSSRRLDDATRKVTDRSIFFDMEFTLSNGTVTNSWSFY